MSPSVSLAGGDGDRSYGSSSSAYVHFDYSAIIPTSEDNEAGLSWAGGPTFAGGFSFRNRPWLRFEGMASLLYAGAMEDENGSNEPVNLDSLDQNISHSFHVFGLANLYADADLFGSGGLGAYLGVGVGPYFSYVKDRVGGVRDTDAVLMFAGHAGLVYRFGGRTGRREAVLGYSFYSAAQDRRLSRSSGALTELKSEFHSARVGLRMRY